MVAVEDVDGNEVWIPVWMTEPRAADARLSDSPLIGVKSLLAVAALVVPERTNLRPLPGGVASPMSAASPAQAWSPSA